MTKEPKQRNPDKERLATSKIEKLRKLECVCLNLRSFIKGILSIEMKILYLMVSAQSNNNKIIKL